MQWHVHSRRKGHPCCETPKDAIKNSRGKHKRNKRSNSFFLLRQMYVTFVVLFSTAPPVPSSDVLIEPLGPSADMPTGKGLPKWPLWQLAVANGKPLARWCWCWCAWRHLESKMRMGCICTHSYAPMWHVPGGSRSAILLSLSTPRPFPAPLQPQ
jgi:hypothetical protein